MTKFKVYEVQDCSTWRKFLWTVEAETQEEAIALVVDGEGGDPEDFGTYGDEDFGDSGFSTEGWSEAADDMPEKALCRARAPRQRA
jgi:hypothetical protein